MDFNIFFKNTKNKFNNLLTKNGKHSAKYSLKTKIYNNKPKERSVNNHMLTLRAEYDDGEVKKGNIYEAEISRGFIRPEDCGQFIRSIDPTQDFGRLVLFIDLYSNGNKLLTTFAYNTLEFNEKWTMLN